jgi:hypothetical protein
MITDQDTVLRLNSYRRLLTCDQEIHEIWVLSPPYWPTSPGDAGQSASDHPGWLIDGMDPISGVRGTYALADLTPLPTATIEERTTP